MRLESWKARGLLGSMILDSEKWTYGVIIGLKHAIGTSPVKLVERLRNGHLISRDLWRIKRIITSLFDPNSKKRQRAFSLFHAASPCEYTKRCQNYKFRKFLGTRSVRPSFAY